MAVKQGGSTLTAALRTLLFSHLIGFTALLGLVLLRHDTVPQTVALGWALLAGLIAGISIVCFFFALAQAPMGAAAALSGLLAAAIPAALTLLLEGSPGPMKLCGFLLAGVAIWYIASVPAPNYQTAGGQPPGTSSSKAHTLLLAVLAGIGFGLYFIALKMAGSSGVLWPMVVVRVGSLAACGLMFLLLRLRSPRPSRSTTDRYAALGAFSPTTQAINHDSTSGRATTKTADTTPSRSFAQWVLLAAVLGTGGDLTFLAATRVGRLDIASVLASMYPASTILLAARLLGEHLSRRQVLGMAFALVAVVLITL